MRLTYDQARAEIAALIADAETLVSAVFSGRLSNTQPGSDRVDLRPLRLGDSLALQVVEQTGQQVATANQDWAAARGVVEEVLARGFANVTVTTTSQLWQCRFTRKRVALVHTEAQSSRQRLEHDRVKARMLPADEPLLVAVGISTEDGRVKASKQDKFRQIDDFLRVLAASVDKAIEAGHLDAPSAARPLRIVDLGCGHAYLTFAAYAWAQRVRGWPALVVGVDRRLESVQRNRALAEQTGAAGMQFVVGDIADTPGLDAGAPDVVLALHACDTATDDALAWAVRERAAIILAAPCCHHDLQRQFQQAPEPWGVLTRHGIVRERLLDLATDSLRAAILREWGYRAELFEFVSGEHTPRNIMLRAVRTGHVAADALGEREQLAQMLGVEPALLQRLRGLDR